MFASNSHMNVLLYLKMSSKSEPGPMRNLISQDFPSKCPTNLSRFPSPPWSRTQDTAGFCVEWWIHRWNWYFPVALGPNVHPILSLTKPIVKLHLSTRGFQVIFRTSCYSLHPAIFYYFLNLHVQKNSYFLHTPREIVSMYMNLYK